MVKRTAIAANEDGMDDARGVPGAQALGKAFALLNMIADAPHPMRFSDLMGYSGVPRGSLHRLLQALQEVRMIRLDERDQTYRLGNRVFEMAHRVWNDFDLRGAAEPELERLRSLTSETTRLGLLDGDCVLIIDQREFMRPMRLGNGVGSRVTATASAIGKAMLAYRPPADLAALLSGDALTALTPNTISNPQEFQRDLDLVKARGYAISVEEQFIGVSAVAAPILDHRGQAIGAISVTGAANRLTVDKLHALGRDVIEAARRTAGNVGENFMSISATTLPARSVEPALKCVVPSSAFLGEGPVWIAGSDALLWVDILAPSVNLSTPATGQTRTVALGELVGAVVPRRRGGYVAATQSGFRGLDVQNGEMTNMTSPADMTGRRFNDAKCDASGRLWGGTLALDASPGKGVLYRLDTDGTLHQVGQGFDICNGMGWNAEGTVFYLADSGARAIYAYDFDLAGGSISHRRIFAQFDASDGTPDGLAIDAEGGVWCAMWDGWEIRRYLPDGKLDRTVSVPVPRPTSCAFGGPDLKTLYITSARIRLSSSQLAAAPLSGGIFALPVDVPGVPVAAFGG
jgi:sugar lactone lactonase YvrE/DNA-binding IclR family transcriptional regulator